MKSPVQKKHSKRSSSASKQYAGFTLVEMLVSVALVLLMMLMFTQIFETLSGSMVTQRGLSENDQRARMLTTVIKADLDNRTFQYLLPFVGKDPLPFTPTPEDPRNKELRASERYGYFYISENDPNDDTDDLIQFTVSRTANPSPTEQPFYFGKATDLSGRLTPPNDLLSINPNQPEADDARIIADGTAQSSAAEVCYFLRGSNLYRRQMLIREKLNITGIGDAQPVASAAAGGESFFVRPAGTVYYGDRTVSPVRDDNFWGDFDFSAYIFDDGNRYARFHSIESLDNETTPGGADLPLAYPRARFGFNHVTGRSREFAIYLPETGPIPPTPPIFSVFMGRFTQGETSKSTFNYPHELTDSSVGGGGNPMDAAAGPQFYVVPEDRSLVAYNDPNDRSSGVSFDSNGPRRSEDLVLSNVISFDIKVFDEGAGDFVDIGGSAASTFSVANNQNNTAGNLQYSNVFDTWHWDEQVVPAGANTNPPYPLLSDFDLVNQDIDSGTAGIQLPTAAPLRAIQIIIQYKDVSSDQLRQISLIHPLQN